VTSDLAEQPQPGQWSKRQTLAAVAVAVVIGGAGGAAIYAATAGTPHAMAGAVRGPAHAPAPAPHPGAASPAQAPAAAPSPDPAVVHSEYVVSDGHGGFVTKMTQTGVVDEATLSQIVVRSDDGFTQIYAFPSGSAAQTVAAKDTVVVEATRNGTTLTLDRIAEGQPPPEN
jgi:hypothetical protein